MMDGRESLLNQPFPIPGACGRHAQHIIGTKQRIRRQQHVRSGSGMAYPAAAAASTNYHPVFKPQRHDRLPSKPAVGAANVCTYLAHQPWRRL